jgi:hypothetical protein
MYSLGERYKFMKIFLVSVIPVRRQTSGIVKCSFPDSKYGTEAIYLFLLPILARRQL